MKIDLLVSLLSDQTIPNIQFIMEKKCDVDKYLFISTIQMEAKGIMGWIVRSAGIEQEKVMTPLLVDQFSFEDIKAKLDAFGFSKFENVVVNITCGTKVMSLAAYEYFRQLTNYIYYLPGYGDNIICLTPIARPKCENLTISLNLAEYVEAYGFTLSEGSSNNIGQLYTENFFFRYTGLITEEIAILRSLQPFRRKGIAISEINGLESLLKKLDFQVENTFKLDKYEVKYLTGEWFEEYIFYKIKNELGLNDDQIKTGITLTKKSLEGDLVTNEFDVIFVYRTKLYTIECKTSVFLSSQDGSANNNIIRETIFKTDSLQKGLGLFAKSSIFSLDSRSVNLPKMHLDRAKLYQINIRFLEEISTAKSISSLIM